MGTIEPEEDNGSRANQEGGQMEGERDTMMPLSSVELTEEKDPLLIFPEEVWTIILEKLKGRDVLSCLQACSLFKKILKPARCTWLFCEVFPHLVPYLGKVELLDCRETGREWKQVVDGYLEGHNYYLPFNEATYDYRHLRGCLATPPINRNGFGTTGFSESKQVLAFKEKMSNDPNMNPFIGRSLWIQCDDDDYLRQEDGNVIDRGPRKFWLAVFDLLEAYGQHVWYFSVGRFCNNNNLSRLLYVLKGCLSRLPNLRRLRIMGGVSSGTRVVYEEGEMEQVEESRLAEYLERKPLPTLPYLESLHMDSMTEDPNLIYELLIGRHGSQLKALSFHRFLFSDLSSGLPSLKELELYFGPEDMDRMERVLSGLQSPLGKLNFHFDSDETELDVERFFRLISDSFGGTLKVLQILVRLIRMSCVPCRAPREREPLLRCPQLRTLDLNGFTFNTFSMDFLLGVAPSLQFLHLRRMSYDGERRDRIYSGEETLDIYHYARRVSVASLYKSNVWEKMEELKMISLEAKCSVEDDYVERLYRKEMLEFMERSGTLVCDME